MTAHLVNTVGSLSLDAFFDVARLADGFNVLVCQRCKIAVVNSEPVSRVSWGSRRVLRAGLTAAVQGIKNHLSACPHARAATADGFDMDAGALAKCLAAQLPNARPAGQALASPTDDGLLQSLRAAGPIPRVPELGEPVDRLCCSLGRAQRIRASDLSGGKQQRAAPGSQRCGCISVNLPYMRYHVMQVEPPRPPPRRLPCRNADGRDRALQ